MVRLGKDNDAVYEEILPSGKKFLTSTFNNNEMEHEYAIYNNHKRQTEKNLLKIFIC